MTKRFAFAVPALMAAVLATAPAFAATAQKAPVKSATAQTQTLKAPAKKSVKVAVRHRGAKRARVSRVHRRHHRA